MRLNILKLVLITTVFLSGFLNSFAQLLKVGDQAPNFTLKNLEGEQVSLFDFHGQIVHLTFFATWCAPCVVEMPLIEKEIWQNYKNSGVKILAIDQMESPLFVDDFIKAKGISYEALIDENGSVTGQYILRLPHNVLINQKGTIVHTAPGLELDNIKNLIDEMLLISDVTNPKSESPNSFGLSIFPNPSFLTRNQTDVTFLLSASEAAHGVVFIFNILGQRVRSLDINLPANGQLNLKWNLRDHDNILLPRGIYFVRFNAGAESIMQRFLLLN